MLSDIFFTKAYAANDFPAAKEFIFKVFTTIINPIIILAFFVAIAVFIWGVIVFINSTDNISKRNEGKNHMLWGIIGMTIMVSGYGIIQLIGGTIGQQADVNKYLSR